MNSDRDVLCPCQGRKCEGWSQGDAAKGAKGEKLNRTTRQEQLVGLYMANY